MPTSNDLCFHPSFKGLRSAPEALHQLLTLVMTMIAVANTIAGHHRLLQRLAADRAGLMGGTLEERELMSRGGTPAWLPFS